MLWLIRVRTQRRVMEAKDTLWHINWGDGDNTYVLAPDEKTAKGMMPEGEDMVNYMAKMDSLDNIIFKAGKLEGRREVVDFIGEEPFEHNYDMGGHRVDDCFACLWEAKLKEWGIDERRKDG